MRMKIKECLTVNSFHAGLMDPSLPPRERFRMSQVVGHYCSRDENVQVNGMVIIIDFTGFTTKHMSSINMGDMKKFSNAMQVSISMVAGCSK